MFVVCTCASSVIIHNFPHQLWFASTVAALSQIFVSSKNSGGSRGGSMGFMEPPFADNLRISQPMALCFLKKYK